MREKTKQKFRDRRLNRRRTFIREFVAIFLIVYISSIGFTLLYNHLLQSNNQLVSMTIAIIFYLLFICFLASTAISFLQNIFFTKKLQSICNAAKKVARGDFTVRVNQWQEEGKKNEIGILVDDFNTMVAELSSIETLKDDFISDVSHEIKTPLSVIKGYSELLQKPALSEGKRMEYAAEISGATAKLTKLVTNILKLNKIESQEIVQKQQFSLDEQLRCCVLNFEESFESKPIQLLVDLEETQLMSDQSLLEIVWNNLLGNALKFTEPGGTVRVQLQNSDSRAVVTVSDSGCGMSEETKMRIFDKFYQGDTSHSAEGNGLGLSLVQRVILLVQGEIAVESTPGKGTTFVVSLPL